MMKKILFVCMGNICRSPSAQGVFEKILIDNDLDNNFFVDSAGTHSYHINSSPDLRSNQFAKMRGIDISKQQARKVEKTDFDAFDYIVAMDSDNYRDLIKICPSQHKEKVYRMMRFSPESRYLDIPDPYYGGERGFELVLDLLENACNGLLKHIQSSIIA